MGRGREASRKTTPDSLAIEANSRVRPIWQNPESPHIQLTRLGIFYSPIYED
jgi:hypothetical protein